VTLFGKGAKQALYIDKGFRYALRILSLKISDHRHFYISIMTTIDYATEVSRQILSHSFTSHQPFDGVLFLFTL